MIKFILTLLVILFIGVSCYVYYNSQRTFEAKFKNIDGLPKGASVTALGVKIGEVIRTRPTNDGIIVTVRITNKSASKPQGGSELSITSFRPGHGRVLEVIPPSVELPETEAWIVEEPITTENWLNASLELLEGLKNFSSAIIKYVTPENFELARSAFSEASDVLKQTVIRLWEHESNLINLKKDFSAKAEETNQLLLEVQKPISALNEIINDKKITTAFKSELSGFSNNLAAISKNITSNEFLTNLSLFKSKILDNLNEINASLTSLDKSVTDSEIKQKLKSFNLHLTNLNAFYDRLKNQDVQKIKLSLKKAREATVDWEKETSKIEKQLEKGR